MNKQPFYSKLSTTATKLIFLSVYLKRDDIKEFRRINWVAMRGIKKMESNAFSLMHGMKRLS